MLPRGTLTSQCMVMAAYFRSWRLSILGKNQVNLSSLSSENAKTSSSCLCGLAGLPATVIDKRTSGSRSFSSNKFSLEPSNAFKAPELSELCLNPTYPITCSWRGLQTRSMAPSRDLGLAQPILKLTEVVDLINENLGIDLCVISIPPSNAEIPSDYVVTVSGRSSRHLRLMAHSLVREFKGRAREQGKSARATIHGEDSNNWIVVDLGDTVVHLMLPETRELYDLESLWLLGPEYDEQYQEITRSKNEQDVYVWKSIKPDELSTQ